MNSIEQYTEKTFENIKHIDEYGNEYWEARELMPLLEYSKWENFHKVIKRAMIACQTSNNNILDHFPEFRKPIVGGKGNVQNVIDYHLSRYACYLIVQNANPRKKSVALGQTYFAIQTRKQEITEIEYSKLSEDEKSQFSNFRYLFRYLMLGFPGAFGSSQRPQIFARIKKPIFPSFIEICKDFGFKKDENMSSAKMP